MMQGGTLELSGTVATLALLSPFVVLAVVVWRALREGEPRASTTDAATPAALSVAKLPHADEVALDERTSARPVGGNDGELAKLYLMKARAAVSAGDAGAATGFLRQSIGHAQLAGDVSIHADARLDLADMAREAGDLTTACEHWQIARKLFIDASRKDRLAEADALMLRHGCPTDWVLTDF